jgi:vacuolar-type H+-ATPase subunit D/Vma8
MGNYKLSLKDLKRKQRTLEDNRDELLKNLIPIIAELEEIKIYIDDEGQGK